MSCTESVSAIKKAIEMVGLAEFARMTGIGLTTIRHARSESWNPTRETIEAAEPVAYRILAARADASDRSVAEVLPVGDEGASS